MAAKDGYEQEVARLLVRGAPLRWASAWYIAPLEYAFLNARIGLVKLVYGRYETTLRADEHDALLHLLSQGGDAELFTFAWGKTGSSDRQRWATTDHLIHIANSRGVRGRGGQRS